jgi:hypothetical protein
VCWIHRCAVLDGASRRALRGRPASDLGVLSALEHEQAISDPVARERCFELVGSLGDVGPAFEVQRDHHPGSEDLGDIGGVIGGQGQVGAVEFGSWTAPAFRIAIGSSPVLCTIARTTSREALSPET